MRHAIGLAILFWGSSLCDSAGRASLRQTHHGPFVGHVSHDEANLWMRASEGEEVGIRIHRVGTNTRAVDYRTAETENDSCVRWRFGGLEPSTVYEYLAISRSGSDGKITELSIASRFETAPSPSAEASVLIAFGSCAKEDAGTAATWATMEAAKPDAVVLLGDTPYIDTTDLEKQRSRYREFAAYPDLARLLSHTSWYGTWDDHDFGRDGSDGKLRGKRNSRRAFLEYHALPSYGNGKEGIYTSFRRGPVEVFLLDARYFANTEPSPFEPKSPTLLGKAQWLWLERGLRASTAPVKVLACGMIFNSAVRPNKPDHWGVYPHERDALFRMIGRHGIRGVVLVSGDIHRSRVVRHSSSALAGYDLVELITSPLHGSIITAANAPHPGLIKDMGAPHTFLILSVHKSSAGTKAFAEFIQSGGEVLFRHPIQLSKAPR